MNAQHYLDILKGLATLLPAVILFMGTLQAACTALYGLVAGAVKLLGWQGGRLDHFGQLCAAAGLDIGKALGVLKKVYAWASAKLGPKVGPAAVVLVAAASLLYAAPARAQNVMPSCFGFTNIHCGPAMSVFEVAPLGIKGGLASDVPAAVGGGYQVEVHFRLWDLAAAFFGNLIYFWKGQPAGEVSSAVFACAGAAFGKLHGSCIGIGAPWVGPEGGILANWTWARDTRVFFAAGPDLIGWLAAL